MSALEKWLRWRIDKFDWWVDRHFDNPPDWVHGLPVQAWQRVCCFMFGHPTYDATGYCHWCEGGY